MSAEMDLMLERAGISYRQFDHWARRGFINARFVAADGREVDGGTGHTRRLDEEEAQVLVRMGRLVERGFTPNAAAVIARRMVVAGLDTVQLDDDLTVQLDGDKLPPISQEEDTDGPLQT